MANWSSFNADRVETSAASGGYVTAQKWINESMANDQRSLLSSDYSQIHAGSGASVGVNCSAYGGSVVTSVSSTGSTPQSSWINSSAAAASYNSNYLNCHVDYSSAANYLPAQVWLIRPVWLILFRFFASAQDSRDDPFIWASSIRVFQDLRGNLRIPGIIHFLFQSIYGEIEKEFQSKMSKESSY